MSLVHGGLELAKAGLHVYKGHVAGVGGVGRRVCTGSGGRERGVCRRKRRLGIQCGRKLDGSEGVDGRSTPSGVGSSATVKGAGRNGSDGRRPVSGGGEALLREERRDSRFGAELHNTKRGRSRGRSHRKRGGIGMGNARGGSRRQFGHTLSHRGVAVGGERRGVQIWKIWVNVGEKPRRRRNGVAAGVRGRQQVVLVVGGQFVVLLDGDLADRIGLA